MEKLILTFLGHDDWCRPVYKDNNGRLWKDTEMESFNTKKFSKYSFCSTDSFDGEPFSPMDCIEKYKNVEVELKF